MNKAVPVLYRLVHGSSIRLGYFIGWIRYRTERQKACSMRQIASYDKSNIFSATAIWTLREYPMSGVTEKAQVYLRP